MALLNAASSTTVRVYHEENLSAGVGSSPPSFGGTYLYERAA